MHFSNIFLISTDSVPSEERYWTQVLRTVIWFPAAVLSYGQDFLPIPCHQKLTAFSQSRWEKTEKINSITVEWTLEKTLITYSVLLWYALKTVGIWRQESELQNITNLLSDQLRFCKSLLRLWQLLPITDVVLIKPADSEKTEQDL